MHRREPGFKFIPLLGYPFPEMLADVHPKQSEDMLDLGVNNYLVEGVVVKLNGNVPVLAEASDIIDTNFRVVVKDGLLETATLRFADNWKFETDQFAAGVLATLEVGDLVKCTRIADDAITHEPRFVYSKIGPGETPVGVIGEIRANSAVIKCPAA